MDLRPEEDQKRSDDTLSVWAQPGPPAGASMSFPTAPTCAPEVKSDEDRLYLDLKVPGSSHARKSPARRGPACDALCHDIEADRDRLAALVLHVAAECHRRKWAYEDGPTFDALHEIGEMLRPAAFADRPRSSRRAEERWPDAEETARLWHNTREKLEHPDSRMPWRDMPEQYRKSMITTAEKQLDWLRGKLTAGESQASEPAAPKLAQGGRPDGCGPDCSEGHTYAAGCALEPPARADLRAESWAAAEDEL